MSVNRVPKRRFTEHLSFSYKSESLSTSSSTLSLYHLHLIFIGILLTFSPMHFLGFNVMPRRIPSFPDTFHSWNLLSERLLARSQGANIHGPGRDSYLVPEMYSLEC